MLRPSRGAIRARMLRDYLEAKLERDALNFSAALRAGKIGKRCDHRTTTQKHITNYS